MASRYGRHHSSGDAAPARAPEFQEVHEHNPQRHLRSAPAASQESGQYRRYPYHSQRYPTRRPHRTEDLFTNLLCAVLPPRGFKKIAQGSDQLLRKTVCLVYRHHGLSFRFGSTGKNDVIRQSPIFLSMIHARRAKRHQHRWRLLCSVIIPACAGNTLRKARIPANHYSIIQRFSLLCVCSSQSITAPLRNTTQETRHYEQINDHPYAANSDALAPTPPTLPPCPP